MVRAVNINCKEDNRIMTYFVNHLSLYSPKNRACKKHVLIKDDCSLDALSSLIEDRIREINTSHPKLRPICYSRNHSLQRITASVLPASGVPDYVFIMDFCQVRSIFQHSEKVSVVPGICSVCGCTENDPCYHPDYGTCWWADEEHTLCSHCAEKAVTEDPLTTHCINAKEDGK